MSKRPNIVFIMSDDHAAHAISAYGSRINHTPNIDRLAQEGVRCDNCHVTNSICTPSRATILTGQYGHINGVMTLSDALDGNRPVLLQKLLKQAGYQTAIFGKWHLGHGGNADPTGFDQWKVLPGQGDYHDPMFHSPDGEEQHTGYVTELLTGMCTEFLDRRDPDKPFFLCCHHKAPHRWWEPSDKYKDLFKDVDLPLPDTFDDDYSNRCDAATRAEMRVDSHMHYRDLKLVPPAGVDEKTYITIPQNLDDFSLTTREGQTHTFQTRQQVREFLYQRYIKDYLRCVQSIDDSVGGLMDYLDDHGLTDNTIVIYTSDQGFFLGDHGWYDKRFIYEHSLQMPFLMRLPGSVQPGHVCDAIMTNHDFAPTLLDYAGVDIPDAMQGLSARPILEGEVPDNWQKSVYYRYWMHLAHHGVTSHYGVRNHRYKLIYFYGEALNSKGAIDSTTEPQWELFDLETDPFEINSVFDDPAYASAREDMLAELDRLQVKYHDQPRHQPGTFRHCVN